MRAKLLRGEQIGRKRSGIVQKGRNLAPQMKPCRAGFRYFVAGGECLERGDLRRADLACLESDWSVLGTVEKLAGIAVSIQPSLCPIRSVSLMSRPVFGKWCHWEVAKPRESWPRLGSLGNPGKAACSAGVSEAGSEK